MARAKGSRSGFEPVAHTADLAVRAWGTSLEELFEQAAMGLISLMLDPKTVQPASVRTVSAQAQEPEELLVAWLNEVLFVFEGEHFAPASVRVKSLGGGKVTSELRGEDFDRARHKTRHSVKAATYHDLVIKRTGDTYEVRVIFDV